MDDGAKVTTEIVNVTNEIKIAMVAFDFYKLNADFIYGAGSNCFSIGSKSGEVNAERRRQGHQRD